MSTWARGRSRTTAMCALQADTNHNRMVQWGKPQRDLMVQWGQTVTRWLSGD